MTAVSVKPLTHLGELSIADFMRDYWQKKPLLVRGAFTDLPQLEADQLAGFALEDQVESRLIIERSDGRDGLKSQWQVHHGPLNEVLFGRLPESNWTLLIQAIDQLLPEVLEVLHRFRFLPNWRLDDVMASYAADGGGVGPHFDYYDVFLLQTQGQRHWRMGPACDATTALRPNLPQKLLTEFTVVDEFTVNAGDLLYIPPRVAHWGVARGECATLSVGFRAPSAAEALLGFADFQATVSQEDFRLCDPDLDLRPNPGLILPQDISRARKLLLDLLTDEEALQEWFGCHMTQKTRESPQFDADTTDTRLAPGSRAAYLPGDANHSRLFLNGEAFTCSTVLAKALCSYTPINTSSYDQQDRQLLELLRDNEWLI